MGEANRRKHAARFELPIEHKHIAEAIASTEIFTDGGACFLYNILGKMALTEQGIETSLVRGGLVYRVGPSASDAVFFCNADNRAEGEMHHCWLETPGGLLIDFSTKEWKRIAEAEATAEQAMGFAPINWQVDPPVYIWRPRREVVDLSVAATSGGMPRVGKAFYNAAEAIGEDRPLWVETSALVGAMLPGIRAWMAEVEAA